MPVFLWCESKYKTVLPCSHDTIWPGYLCPLLLNQCFPVEISQSRFNAWSLHRGEKPGSVKLTVWLGCAASPYHPPLHSGFQLSRPRGLNWLETRLAFVSPTLPQEMKNPPSPPVKAMRGGLGHEKNSSESQVSVLSILQVKAKTGVQL